ncbi:MAG: hypothetical protein AAF307_02795 [Pseudomonadota bacterium]
MMVSDALLQDGFAVFDAEPSVLAWAKVAHAKAMDIAQDPQIRAGNLRHGATWFVGVDALPNAPDGSIDHVPLSGEWQSFVDLPEVWHAAQLSVIYPGYPRQDRDESDANHRFRRDRHAAHVDGLLPVGPTRRRYVQEPHGFILGLPLNRATASPLMVWPGSHRIMNAALRTAIGAQQLDVVDVTSPYKIARKQVFETVVPRPVQALPGQAILLHRHLLHGVAPWSAGAVAPPEGRMVAYFRPQTTSVAWLSPN